MLRAALLTLALAVIAAAPARAQSFSAPTTIAGFGNQPALAQVTGASQSAIAGTSDNRRGATEGRRAVMSLDGGAAQGFGPVTGAFDVAFAANDRNNTAMTYTVGHVAYLTTCAGSSCRTQRAGSSAVKPQSAVAIQPGTTRTLVLWRGRTRRGANRLQWRITTNGRLGHTHTLGEFGDSPQLATDAAGRTVAVWLADRRAKRTGVRTAARGVGEFTRPTSVTTTPAADLRVVTSNGGETVAAWLSNPAGVDVEQPSGVVQTATRTRTTGFGVPSALGPGSTVSLAGAPDGHALVVTVRRFTSGSDVVAAARRTPGGAFGPLTGIAPPQTNISDAYPATASIADTGRALVSWASGSGVFATIAAGAGEFAAPQQLATADNATLPQPTAPAISPTRALVAWTGPRGAQLAQSSSQPK